ncbi:MAG: poly-gamma-glutamate synthase PgsB [Fusobacteriales bacterium]|nr:MAG: poly-gamma-glutamate synthase PgsB [Fusobacteriales bacterium]
MKIILCGILLFIFYLTIEKILNNKRRKKIKYIIHVNGIRGKSTVSRLIDAGLRESNYKIFTKITGTAPRIINTFNEELEIIRKGKANIREQIEVLKWATKEGADIVILECMAVNPDFQKTCENSILKADISVITNVREDHLDEMGKDLDEIAESLSNTIVKNGNLYTAEKKYFKYFEKKVKEKNTKIFLADNLKKEYEEIDFPENVALALEVCKFFGVSEAEALNGMKNYKKDMGVLDIITFNKKNKIHFVNAMAANDPMSTEKILDKIILKSIWNNKRILLLSNRKDRVSRGEQLAKLTKKIEKYFDEIIIFGESRELLKKILIKEKVKKEKIRLEKDRIFLEKIEEETLIFAVGNICGSGKELLEYIKKEENNA